MLEAVTRNEWVPEAKIFFGLLQDGQTREI